MPEGLEAEIWQRASTPLIGRTVGDVWVDGRVADPDVVSVMQGARITGVRRVGKVLLLVLDIGRDHPPREVGLHFGMTGRLVIDGASPIEQLEYASGADRPDWDRIRIWTERSDPDDPDGQDGPDRPPALRMNDPRRLGRISLDPDLSGLGPDSLGLTARELAAALAGRRAAVKTLLLGQGVVAGLGNLCADEVLLHAGIDPRRSADTLDDAEIASIADASRRRLPIMLERGGSTEGDLTPVLRAAVGPCPIDGTPLRRERIGGRTTVWCPHCQR